MQAVNCHGQSLVNSIFLNPKILKEVNRVEESLALYPVENLMEALIVGTDFSLEKVEALMKRKVEVITYLSGSINQETKELEYSHGDWRKFGVYNTGACRYMAIRSEFVVSILNDYPELVKPLADNNIKKHQLERISRLPMATDYPNIAWSIKLLALRKGWSNFEGIQANTTPCRKATEYLFNKSYCGDQFGHTLLCQKISTEIGIPLMKVNTILWAMGSKL